MRRAEAEDAWRHAVERDRQFRLKRLRLSRSAPFAEADERLPNGLLILCGLNGVGKTTLLDLIEASLKGTASTDELSDIEVEVLRGLTLTAEIDGGDVDFAISEDKPDQAPEVVVLDAFELLAGVLGIAKQSNFEDLLEGVEAREYATQELEIAKYVIGKEYTAIRVFEIEDPSVVDRVLPAFQVETAEASYDFRAMGLGELAALMALWYLKRAAAATVVLVEEPETFLSARSTVALADVLAESVHKQRLYAVVTTHSIEIVARAPLETIRLLAAGDGGVTIRSPATRTELEQLLGAYVGQTKIVLVEDRTASAFAGELLARFGGLWGEGVAVTATEGASRLRSLCKDLPLSPGLALLGLLDGDEAVPPEAETNWPVLNLPGGRSPDSLLKAAALSNRPLLADRIAREGGALDIAIDAVAGREEHDWFPELARLVGVEVSMLIRAATHCWLSDGANEGEARAMVQQVVDRLAS